MLKLESVSKNFGQNGLQLKVLEEVSFEVEEGEFVAVVGPSGCGKTTLLKLIAELFEPNSGTIKSNGGLDAGFVFQQPNLLAWRTVEENVNLPLEIQKKAGKKATKLVNLVGLKGFGSFFPEQLSGGMQQRVAIARALATNPDVLLMDEPFSAIDDLGREELNLALMNVWQKTGKTILFVTHNLEEAVFLADKIIVLSERPTRVKRIMQVSLKRPRNPEIKYTQIFQGHVKWLKSIISG